jgi:hypothetical protein
MAGCWRILSRPKKAIGGVTGRSEKAGQMQLMARGDALVRLSLQPSRKAQLHRATPASPATVASTIAVRTAAGGGFSIAWSVFAAIGQLRTREHELIGLRVAAALSFRKVAAVLGMSEQAAKVATRRANCFSVSSENERSTWLIQDL